jgi:hypothetical protein
MKLAGLPAEVQQVFERFITTEYVTIDGSGQPIAWPVTPYVHDSGDCIDVTTGVGYPKKADDAAANPRVALLFSHPKGSRMPDAPMVLVQGTAHVDDADLDANARRYESEAVAKLPAVKDDLPPAPLRRFVSWYFKRIYVHVRPERVYVWEHGDTAAEPQLLDAHLEEVRSGHNEEPEAPAAAAGDPAPGVWDGRLDDLGRTHDSAVLAVVGPDGFPFAVRVPVSPDAANRVVRLGGDAVGAPLRPGRACLTAHDHGENFEWQRNFQVRGDLVQDDSGEWLLRPRRFVGGFELPPGSALERYRFNAKRFKRYRKVAKREIARRTAT